GAAEELGIRVDVVEVRRPEQLGEAFAAAVGARCEAMVALPASLVTRYAGRIAELALTSRLPAISYFREFPEAGGLMSYGPNFDELCRRAAVYVDKILKGARPAELPAQQPTTLQPLI